jgi:hypothetical protein
MLSSAGLKPLRLATKEKRGPNEPSGRVNFPVKVLLDSGVSQGKKSQTRLKRRFRSVYKGK